MPTPQDINSNIETYSAEELVDFIKQGIITHQDLERIPEPWYSREVRARVTALLSSGQPPTPPPPPFEGHANPGEPNPHVTVPLENSWDTLNKTSIGALRQFIKENPYSPHISEANGLLTNLIKNISINYAISELIHKINSINSNKALVDPIAAISKEVDESLRSNKITTDDLLALIAHDPNIFFSENIHYFLHSSYFTTSDLQEFGIDERFIKALLKHEEPSCFTPPVPLIEIGKTCTEVYFWGIPASGKTCAMGAIMSVAGNCRIAKSMAPDDCQGYNYMTRLMQLFKVGADASNLPPRTGTTETYEMSFDLEDDKHRIHPITIIDLAGELVRCMYKVNSNLELNDAEKAALNTVRNLLIDNRSGNRKMHFFVIEYGAESRLYEGIEQQNYLQGALKYIQDTKIFRKDTDAIFLIITKVDRVGLTGNELNKVLERYIEETYPGFYGTLCRICRVNEINGGKVLRIPFSLGQVAFRDFCIFDDEAASIVVNIILNRSKGFKAGKLGKLAKTLSE